MRITRCIECGNLKEWFNGIDDGQNGIIELELIIDRWSL